MRNKTPNYRKGKGELMLSYFNIHKFHERKAVIDCIFYDMNFLCIVASICLAISYQMADLLNFQSAIEIVLVGLLLVFLIWAILLFIVLISTLKFNTK